MIIDGVEYVRKDPGSPDVGASLQYVIVRCTGAGVHAGYLFSKAGAEVELVNSRRLWRWHARGTLSGLANEGVDDVLRCKFGDTLPRITLREWWEIIPCTDAARRSIEGVPKWEND